MVVATLRALSRVAAGHKRAARALLLAIKSTSDQQQQQQQQAGLLRRYLLPAPSECAAMLRSAERLPGGLLSRLVCRQGGLEALLQSYLEPLLQRTATAAAVAGGDGGDAGGGAHVAALEQLVAQLARVPDHLIRLEQRKPPERGQR